jgi:hypothetical protein
MKKKTTTKKPAARQIPPPPPGWEIVGKDDPRLKKLPSSPIRFTQGVAGNKWAQSAYIRNMSITQDDLEKSIYALPIATQSATPQPSPPMIPLRWPSEKPTREDGDDNGDIVVFCTHGEFEPRQWKSGFGEGDVAWLPGRTPDGILPREPSQEEKWQREFSEWWTKTGHTDHNGLIADAAWQGFLAAKKGGAE